MRLRGRNWKENGENVLIKGFILPLPNIIRARILEAG